jgi:SAM-dependent methyltransferase
MFRVLKTYAENTAARKRLQQDGLSYWPRTCRRSWYQKLVGLESVPVGELNKSWELDETVRLLLGRVAKSSRIVDLGCYASEILPVLRAAGFQNLFGVDLNPGVKHMPFAGDIRYLCRDMMDTKLPSASFGAVLAMSSIEHGFDMNSVLGEVSRLLEPGGLFIGSTDYWRVKIDTTGIKMFGMDWRIFSEPEIRDFFATAGKHGLNAVDSLELECVEDCIECAGKTYTFGWFALQKAAAA